MPSVIRGSLSKLIGAVFMITILALFTINTAYAQAAGITVKTDKSSYKAGETVKASGTVEELKSGQKVIIEASTARQNTFKVDSVNVTALSSYTYDLKLPSSGPFVAPGQWLIKVTYGNHTAEVAFAFEAGSSQWDIYNVTISKQQYPLNYKVSGGTLKKIVADVSDDSLIVTILPNRTLGTLTIQLPRDIMDAKQGTIDDDYAIFIDGEEVGFEETRNTKLLRTLSIDFDNTESGSIEIEIVGTQVTPEFEITLLLLATTISGMIAIRFRFASILKAR